MKSGGRILAVVLSAVLALFSALLTGVAANLLTPDPGKVSIGVRAILIGCTAAVFVASNILIGRRLSSDDKSMDKKNREELLRSVLFDEAYLRSFIIYLEELQKPVGMQSWVPLEWREAEDAPIRRAQVRIEPGGIRDSGLPHSFAVAQAPVRLFQELSRRRRAVILGEPGSGKSFTVRRWLWELAQGMLSTGNKRAQGLTIPI